MDWYSGFSLVLDHSFVCFFFCLLLCKVGSEGWYHSSFYGFVKKKIGSHIRALYFGLMKSCFHRSNKESCDGYVEALKCHV